MTMLRGTQAVGPDFTQIAWAVVIYFFGVVISTAVIQSVLIYLLMGPTPLFEVLAAFAFFLFATSFFACPFYS
jgi:hypothetical protein